MNKPRDPGGFLHATDRYLFFTSGAAEVVTVGNKSRPVLSSQAPGSRCAHLAAALRSWHKSEDPRAAREEADVF